ncbi:MAG: UbiA family prenyltransferase [Syntrophobacteraceae bacterium]
MNIAFAWNDATRTRIKLFMALSRTPHGVLDMATPAVGALLWLGGVPPLPVALLGFITAFAGYTAVYALNDVVDYRVDREKIKQCGLPDSGHDLDAICARHPLAQGFLSLQEGIAWTAGWALVALLGAYTLNPACAWIFLGGCAAEAIYCKMFRVSYLRTLVSGGVKTAGGLAAVFAVTPNPSVLFLLTLFLWLFFWEIGGQNVPNDWADVTEDRDMEAVTVPVRFGPQTSADIILASLGIAVILSLLLFCITPAGIHAVYLFGALAAGLPLLIAPAFKLRRSLDKSDAAALFNRASYYPPSMLLVILISAWW